MQRMINTWVESSAEREKIVTYICRHILTRAYPRIQAPNFGAVQMLLASTKGKPFRLALAIATTYALRCSSLDLDVNVYAWYSLL